MIEDLKTILDMVGKLPTFALEILGGFALYKLVMYLSTTGAVVMISKLLINKIHDAITRPKPPQEVVEKHEYKITDLCINGAPCAMVIDSLKRVIAQSSIQNRGTKESPNYYRYTYIHEEQAKFIRDAIEEKAQRDGWPK